MKVIKEFKCLRSGRLYLVGSDYPEDDVKRVNELAKKGFLERKIPERSAKDAGSGETGAARKERSV